MSVKNLKKNTRFIKYFKYLKLKIADILDDFADDSGNTKYVYQPCFRLTKDEKLAGSQELQERCAPGWSSDLENSDIRSIKCERKDPKAETPRCDSLSQVSYRSPKGLKSKKSKEFKGIFESLLERGGNNNIVNIINRSLEDLYKVSETEYLDLKESVLALKSLISLDSSDNPKNPPENFGKLDTESKREFILSNFDKLKNNLVPTQVDSKNLLVLHVLEKTLIRKYAPENTGEGNSSKERFRREARSFFELSSPNSELQTLEPGNLINSLPPFLRDLYKENVGKLVNAFNKFKSKENSFSVITKPSVLVNGDESRGIRSSIMTKFRGIGAELQQYLKNNPSIGRPTQDHIDSYLKSVSSFESLFNEEMFKTDINDLSSMYESIPDEFKIEGVSEEEKSQQVRKYMKTLFNLTMNDLHSDITSVSQIDEFNGFDYVRPYLAEFQACVNKMLDKDTTKIYLPKDTNYPFADLEFERSTGGQVLRLFSTSVKSGWKANVGSVTALTSVKFFGENAYPRSSDHLSNFVDSHGDTFKNAMSAQYPNIPQVLNVDLESDKRTNYNFRKSDDHTLFVRPGMNFSIETMSKTPQEDFIDKYFYFVKNQKELDTYISEHTSYSSLQDLLNVSKLYNNKEISNEDKINIEKGFIVLSALKLRNSYSHNLVDDVNNPILDEVRKTGGNLKDLLQSRDIEKQNLAKNLIKELKSGLNTNENVLDPLLSQSFDEYLETISLDDMLYIAHLHTRASGSTPLENIPTGNTGTRLFLNFYANLGTFEGDTQFTSLTEYSGIRNQNDITEHFKKCSLKSKYEDGGLIRDCILNKDKKLGISTSALIDRISKDYMLNDELKQDLKNEIERKSSEIENYTGEQLQSYIKTYLDRVKKEYSTIYVESPIDISSFTAAYVGNKENQGNYAAAGIKSSPHGLPVYAVNLHITKDSSYESEKKAYDSAKNLITRNNEVITNIVRKNLSKVGITSFSDYIKSNISKILKVKFYKLLLKKKSSTNFADGSGKVTQPCVYKDSDGKITGVGTYERIRACYNGWTSLQSGESGNMCVPNTNHANFSYPVCPKDANSSLEDSTDETLNTKLYRALRDNPRLKIEDNFKNLLDNIGIELYNRAQSIRGWEELKKFKANLNFLQALQEPILKKMDIVEMEKMVEEMDAYEEKVYADDREPTPEEMKILNRNKYLYFKYSTYLEDNQDVLKATKALRAKESNHRKIFKTLIKEGRADKLYDDKAIEKNLSQQGMGFKYKSQYGDNTVKFIALDTTRYEAKKVSHALQYYIPRGDEIEKSNIIKKVVNISFTVNDEHAMPKETLTRLEKLELSQALKRMYAEVIKRSPVGTVFINTPYSRDGDEAKKQRINNYKTMGFELIKSDDGTDFFMANIKNSREKIIPLNRETIDNFTELDVDSIDPEVIFDAFVGSKPVTMSKPNSSRLGLVKFYKQLKTKTKPITDFADGSGRVTQPCCL